ncbi:MAG: TonB-dependent receptor [Desulfobacteraceae bacterium]|jgi:outer membrane receptor protein involved in Fe transport
MRGKRGFFHKNWLFCCFILCVLTLTLGGTGVVFAQDDEDEEQEFTLEEITVTAEKREAQLQKIPMDISVFREQEMRFYNVNSVLDIVKIMPDVSIRNEAGSLNLITIRDVQTLMFNPIYESSVATHLDGIQLTSYGGLDNFYFDLERMETLKGPQGTLYGRGSTAGSINIISRKPVLGEFSGNASVEVGDYGKVRADWAVNLPAGEKAALRVSGRRYVFDGYSDSGYGNADAWSHRVSFLWEPNDRLTFRMTGDYSESFDHGAASYGDAGYYMGTYGDVTIVPQDVEPVVDARWQSGGPVHARFKSKWATEETMDLQIVDNESYGMMAILDYDFDFATATVQYGHRVFKEYKDYWMQGARFQVYPYHMGVPWYMPPGSDPSAIIDATPPYTQVTVRVSEPYHFMVTENSSDTDTMEVRLTSNSTISGGDKFEWIVGALAQRDFNREMTEAGGYGSIEQDLSWFVVHGETETEGLFGQGSWMPIDKWELTVGLRQNWDKKILTTNYNWATREDEDRQYSYILDKYSASFSELTYRAVLSYYPTENIMPYLSYAKGYKTGQISYPGAVTDPEILNDWEIGFKSRFLDNKLQFNLGFYYYDYENYSDGGQVYKCWEANADHTCVDVAGTNEPYEPTTGTAHPDGQVNFNDYEYYYWAGYSPGGAEQKGVSIGIEYLPTMNDHISISASWKNSEYGDGYNKLQAVLASYPDADSPWVDFDNVDLEGYEFGGAPIRGNASYSHTFYFGVDTLMTSIGAFYEGKGIDQVINTGFPEEYKMPGRDDYWTFDFNLMYNSSKWVGEGRMWSLRAGVQNIFDNDALSSITYTDDVLFVLNNAYPLGSGTITGNYINPRTYSVTLSINF